MATVKLDRIDTLSLQEKFGVILRCERKAYVSGLTGKTDYTILIDALNSAGVPVYGDALTGTSSCVLTERTPTVIDKDKVEVLLVYEHFLNEGQNFDDPPAGGVFCGEMRTELQQVTTNKDADGELIVVQHTYPADDPNYPGETKQQTGEIQVFSPQRTYCVQGIKTTETPWLIAWAIVAKVNAESWSGANAREWMCTAASWKLCEVKAGSHRYFFTFQFQHNPDTWDPTVVFIDDKTNRPPPDLVEGEGYRTITYLGAVNFNEIIGTFLQGG